MAPAKRELTFLLANPERRLLRAVAARLPAVVTPDHLTALGVLGALEDPGSGRVEVRPDRGTHADSARAGAVAGVLDVG